VPPTSSRATIGWNVAGYLLYAGLLAVGLTEVWYSLFFGMATDACHDSACDASYHVRPAMLTMWIGVGLILTSILVAMLVYSARGKVVVGWPVAGLPALGLVWLLALKILH
jgi:hypothetical protein